MIRRTVQTLALLWIINSWFDHSLASTVSTRASLAAGALRTAISAYLDSGGKTTDFSIATLSKYLKQDIADDIAQGDFWARFQLFPSNPVDGPQANEKIIAIMTFQVSEDRRESLGRYAILADGQGVKVDWISEDILTRLFSKAKVPLLSKGVWHQAYAKAQSTDPEMKLDPAQQKAADDLRRAELIAQDEGRTIQGQSAKTLLQAPQDRFQASPSGSAAPTRTPNLSEAQAIPINAQYESASLIVVAVIVIAGGVCSG